MQDTKGPNYRIDRIEDDLYKIRRAINKQDEKETRPLTEYESLRLSDIADLIRRAENDKQALREIHRLLVELGPYSPKSGL